MVSHQLPRYKPIVPASRTNSKPCVSRADLRHSTPYHKLFKPVVLPARMAALRHLRAGTTDSNEQRHA
jgi:hypothetical protein